MTDIRTADIGPDVPPLPRHCPDHPWDSGVSFWRHGWPPGDNGVTYRCTHRHLITRRRCPWMRWEPT